MCKTIFAVLSGMALATSAAWSQDSQDIEVGAFDRIDAGGGYEIEIVRGDAPSVRLTGDADDFEDIHVEVRNGRLEVEQDSGLFSRRRSLDVVVEVTVTEIRALDFNRGISARVTDIESDELRINVSTGSSSRIAGRCASLDLEASTGSSLNASELICADVDVEASTGASASVHATDSVSASASMGASLRVHGSPPSREVRSTMGGSVHLAHEG
ncbi:head GIN domain-containing protein [Maricaulis sp.]|uniref:head GIN domain-containing protein n=1 Tax=Maricaulis sp. TaxID=1486257 RepID=UPI00260BA245|nr:head GIN domain-containing protein [Maricaulis sp.]